jgi:hypothetical protein
VINALTDQWRRETRARGSRLPGERALAQQLGVSRDTVKIAMEKLVAAGIVRRRGTSGTYLAMRPTPELIDRVHQLGPSRRRGRRSAPSPRARVVTRNTYRLAFLYCLAPGDESVGDVTNGISHYCHDRGHDLSIGFSRPAVGITSGLSEQGYRPDAVGLILWLTLRERDLPHLQWMPVPYVVMTPGTAIDQNCIWLDSSLGCERALELFARAKASHIAVLEVKYPDSAPHLRGTCLTMADRLPGVEIDFFHSPDPVVELLRSPRKHDAIYFADDFCCVRSLPPPAGCGIPDRWR